MPVLAFESVVVVGCAIIVPIVAIVAVIANVVVLAVGTAVGLVCSLQHPDALYRSIDAMYVGCRYSGAAADRPPRALPSKHPGAAQQSRGLIAATPGSSPLSMRLENWSG